MPPKQRSARKIDSADFEGAEELDAGDWRRLGGSSLPSSASDLFPEWTGEPLVIPGLTLTNDNAAAANLSVFVQGDLLEGKKKAVLASRFWPVSDNAIYLNFPSIPGDLFKFGSNMTSSLVDSSRIEHEFTKSGAILAPEEVSDAGVGDFCLKLHLRPTQAAWTAFSISLFPASETTLNADHPQCKNPVFPGICILTGELKLQPRASELFVERATGCPVLPAISTGGDSPIAIKVKEIKAAIAALFRKAVLPENKQNHGTLGARWAAIQQHGPSKLSDGTPDLLWPLPTEVTATVSLGRAQLALFYFSPPNRVVRISNRQINR